MQAGGSLTYLHGGKPFIRGGDFVARQAKGERPMQLNYSRAFGGKDLKMFGLSCEPTVSHFSLDDSDKVLILASDGLWDVTSADSAAAMALAARAEGKDPATVLVDDALERHAHGGTVDNVTVIAVFF
jgi:protein phosphatase PTC2/3